MVDTVLFPNPVQVPTGRTPSRANQSAETGSASSFAKVLDGKMPSQGITFSQHAQERLRERGISLDKAEMEKLEGAVEDVARKGGRESLVLLGDAALVVSVKNRTVVTALDRNSMQGNVFTNIDSAVLFK
ncbi:MAG: TIGR02530 family flagellar biosynthesis protein [Geobacteraceae bacterium]|nr:TIGR02530 family flagellar biosynthesis protein [Geobacteraceae bacterium]